MEKRTINVNELAKLLGISIPTAYRLANDPTFPSIKIGTRVLIPIDELEEWIKKQARKEGVVNATNI